MGIDEHVQVIILFLVKMKDSDIKIVIQIETLLKKYLKETGRL